MRFIVQNTFTEQFVEGVSRTTCQIEKTTDREQAQIFEGDSWLQFWTAFDDYVIVEIDQVYGTCGNCQETWPCTCKYPVFICDICGRDNYDCMCDERLYVEEQ